MILYLELPLLDTFSSSLLEDCENPQIKLFSWNTLMHAHVLLEELSGHFKNHFVSVLASSRH